jgi:hypothetical protein
VQQPTISFMRPSWNSHWWPQLLGPTWINGACRRQSLQFYDHRPHDVSSTSTTHVSLPDIITYIPSLCPSIRIHYIEDACYLPPPSRAFLQRNTWRKWWNMARGMVPVTKGYRPGHLVRSSGVARGWHESPL